MSNLIDKKKYEEKKNQYILKIKKWLNQTKFNIVVVENSDIILMSYLIIIITLKKLFINMTKYQFVIKNYFRKFKR